MPKYTEEIESPTARQTKQKCVELARITERRIAGLEADYLRYKSEDKPDLARDAMRRLVQLYDRKEGQDQVVEFLGLANYVAAALKGK